MQSYEILWKPYKNHRSLALEGASSALESSAPVNALEAPREPPRGGPRRF